MRGNLAALLWVLTVLFMVRVLGQALQQWAPLPLLPPFEEFQGSNLPYEILLALQLFILAVMVRTAWRIQHFALQPSRSTGRLLWWLGGVYMAGSVARIAIGLVMSGAHSWFHAWIPAFFHLVLAAFVLLVACYHLSAFAPAGKQAGEK